MKGKAIIREVMSRFRIGPKDFFGTSHLSHLVKARRIAARRLKKAGISPSVVARLMRRDPRTIAYYLNDEFRERRRIYYAAYHVIHREERIAAYHAKKVRA